MNLTRPALAESSSGLGFFGLWCCSSWPSDSTYFNTLQVRRMGVILSVIAYCALLYSIGEQLFGLQRLVRPHWGWTAATRASRKSWPRPRGNRIDKLKTEFVRYRRLVTKRRVWLALCFG